MLYIALRSATETSHTAKVDRKIFMWHSWHSWHTLRYCKGWKCAKCVKCVMQFFYKFHI